jgi:hypothetical protein
MAGSLGALILELSANTVKWEQDMGRAAHVTARSTEQMSRMFGSVKRAFDTILVGGGAGLFIREFSQAAMEGEQQSARLEATLKATGYTAGLTKYQLDELADSVAEATQFDDDSVREAQSTLLKFGNIQEETFKRALTASADWAAFSKKEIPAAAQDIGRALSSPTAGLTFLERQMGKFSETTKEAITQAEAQGRIWDAQALILAEVERKVGGVAEKLNSDYTKATRDAAKAYDEFLESFGRTSVVKGTVESFLGFVKDSFRDLKEIVENGDWVEKTLAIAAWSAGFRGMKLTPKGGAEDPAEAERARQAAEQARKDAEAAALKKEAEDTAKWFGPLQEKERQQIAGELGKFREMQDGGGDGEFSKLQRRIENDEKFRVMLAGNPGAKEKLLREAARADEAKAIRAFNEQIAKDQEELARATAEMDKEAAEKIIKQRADELKASTESWVKSAEIAQEIADNQVYTWNEAGEQIVLTREAYEQLEEQQKKNAELGKDLGLTFASAFEDAIVAGKEFSDVLKGLAMDVARIFARKMITEPTANLFSGLATSMMNGMGGGAEGGGGGLWSAISAGVMGMFGGGAAAGAGGDMFGGADFSLGFADGGGFTVGGAGGTDSKMVAFRATPGENVSINKPGQAGGGTYFIDARGADAAALARVEMQIQRLHGSIERRAVSAVAAESQRGGSLGRSIGR